MPTRETVWPVGAPCWIDCAFEPEHRGMHHARDFYSKLFGWRFLQHEGNGYAVCLKDEQPVASLLVKSDADQPTQWTTYLASDDADATAAAVESAGGQVVLPPGDVGTAGRAAYFLDPTGAPFGVWQAIEHRGFGLVHEPGSVSWNDLLTPDLTGAKTFYAKVFGYTYADQSDDRATIRLTDGSTGGGMRLVANLRDDEPPSWLVHFAVADRDSSAQLAQELGASILMRLDTAAGREAVLEGTHGEVFTVLELPD